eukprot:SAG31_NODE_100_length_25264_cov_38.715359_22_plen_159_part_00
MGNKVGVGEIFRFLRKMGHRVTLSSSHSIPSRTSGSRCCTRCGQCFSSCAPLPFVAAPTGITNGHPRAAFPWASLPFLAAQVRLAAGHVALSPGVGRRRRAGDQRALVRRHRPTASAAGLRRLRWGADVWGGGRHPVPPWDGANAGQRRSECIEKSLE